MLLFWFSDLNLVHNESEIGHRVNAVINKFAERGLQSLAVAYQVYDLPMSLF